MPRSLFALALARSCLSLLGLYPRRKNLRPRELINAEPLGRKDAHLSSRNVHTRCREVFHSYFIAAGHEVAGHCERELLTTRERNVPCEASMMVITARVTKFNDKNVVVGGAQLEPEEGPRLLRVLASVVTGLYVSHTCCRRKPQRRRVSVELVDGFKEL